MKVKLKNIIGLAALGVALLTTTVPTWAGWVFTPGVTIGSNQLGRFAKGSMVGARYSTDNLQEIACTSFGAAYTESVSQTICFARDKVGNYLYCFNEDAKFQELVQAMTDSSFIYFQTDNSGSSYCKDIRVYHGSEHLK